MKPLPLTKTLDPADYKLLAPELAVVDIFKDSPEMLPQHTHRRWEYAMALRAIEEWGREAPASLRMRRDALDVGGGGSPLKNILNSTGLAAEIIDPGYNYPIERVLEREEAARASGNLRRQTQVRAAVVTCISVIEHVALQDLERFLLALGTVLLPGGLLFLTCDFTDAGGEPPEDKFHFHWMRAQIFNSTTLTRVAETLYRQSNLVLFGGQDHQYHGAQLWDYTFASLCMVKDQAAR